MNAPSVLTLVRGRGAHLARLIEGLARSHVLPAELIVADMDHEPIRLPLTPFPASKVRIGGSALALAKARNAAARAARSDILLFLDVDCIPGSNFVGAMAETVGAQDALVCAEARYLPAGAVHEDWQERDLLSAGRPHPVRPFPVQGCRPETNPGLFWSLAFGVRRAAFERLGGFDERFVGYGAEDTDFGFRAAQAGLPLLFLGGAPVFHQNHEIEDPPLRHFNDIVRNARRFRKRWGVWPMEGWLRDFAASGLIRLSSDAIVILKRPPPSGSINR